MSEYIVAIAGEPPEWGEQIVRCRDCKHYKPHEFIGISDFEHVCNFWAETKTKVKPDGFCAWGERKVDE